MPAAKTHFWSRAPFIRFLIPLLIGILLQWSFSFSFSLLSFVLFLSVGAIFLHFLLPISKKFHWNAVTGLFVHLLWAAFGALLVWKNDTRNDELWIGKIAQQDELIIATLCEPLVEKANSYKALARIEKIFVKGKAQQATGKIIIYFKKDAVTPTLSYGSKIIFKKPLQEIKNSGNPGSFDYRRYNLFQGITHQVYVSTNDFKIVAPTKKIWWQEKIFQYRISIVSLLRKFIHHPQQQALAEALLIGYKNDLDKNLVQAYSNTGVVHIIAISGLHLGLIYALLLLVTKPLKRYKRLLWLRFFIVLAGLWAFSLLAGAQPSILRSCVMFTFIALAEVTNRKTAVYNTLALSAFLLLCYHPFWLWDVGFQLSYAAVLSILVFYRPVYHCIYFPNKALNYLWQLNAVTLSAQILTLPVSLYHFHQFPVLFLFTNFIAVPLSGIILMGEILLCAVSFLPLIASVLGRFLEGCIGFMNTYVQRLDSVSFAVWNGFSLSLVQALILMLVIVFFCVGLVEKKKHCLGLSLAGVFVFIALRSLSFWQAYHQQKLIVYNVPHHQAIDVIKGREYVFVGDEEMKKDDFLRNFHLQPSRMLNRIHPAEEKINTSKIFEFAGKKIMILDGTFSLRLLNRQLPVDVLIISKNPSFSFSETITAARIKQVVIDGSVPAWKALRWKNDCQLLHVPCYYVAENGAFEMKM